MTAALRCDGPECGEIVTDPRAAQRWWRLERNGESIEAPYVPGDLPQLPTVELGAINISMTDDGDGDPEGDETPEDDDPMVVLHFHSARCLAEFAELAAAMEA